MALTPASGNTPEDKKAKKKAAEDEVLLREIDDAVRQDDYARFAESYGKPLLGLLVAGLLAFGGYLYWESRQEAAMESRSETLVSALDQAQAGNLEQASAVAGELEAAEGGSEGAAAAAAMLRAGLAMEQDRPEEAAKIYSGVAADENTPPALRDLALIREMTATFDSRDPQQVVDRLKPLAVPGNAWFGSAGELVAMAHLELGNDDEAGTLFGEIAKDESLPETLRSRARQMAGLLGVDAIEDVDALLDEQGINDNQAAGSGDARIVSQ